jgi:hypothetical protein
MRRTPRGGGSVGNLRCAFCACLAGAAAVCLLWLPSAEAGGCANAGLRSGASEHLPDCRAYEQVSPAAKGGVDAVTVQPLFPAQAARCEEGESCGIAYMNDAAAFAGAQGNELPNAYLARRNGAGWQTTPLTPPTLQPPPNGFATVSYAFSGDLSQAVLRVPLQRLTEDAPAGVYNLFLRAPAGGYSLLTSAAPPLPPGCGSCFQVEDVPAFAGASSDFGHVIFEANDALLPGAPGGGAENLYEHDAASGALRLVGVLPDGTIAAAGASAGGGVSAKSQHARALERAVSQDGSHVLFKAVADGGLPDPQQSGRSELYDRLAAASTVEVSAPALGAQPSKCETRGGLCRAEPAQFSSASADGSIVYFTSKASLTRDAFTGSESAGSENGGNDLYRYEVASGRLSDLTADPTAADANGASVLGVIGSSTDGSYVYFVADGKLAGNAQSGQPNLYVWHGSSEGAGRVSFIATLAPPNAEETEEAELEEASLEFEFVGARHSDIADWTARSRESQAYLTPDGRHLAFMSVMPLTGYGNGDQLTHEADHEVFQYSAETAQLVCASCDPSGAAPRGSAFIGAKLTERASTPFHQPRAMSDDGSRLFFSSPDPLVAGIAGGSVKVFEYESGAAHLISGSGSGSNDVFLDASTRGNDVFIASREQLVPGDRDELVDVYDARVEGGLPSPPTLAPPCQASNCPAPPPPSFSTPLSASYIGPGNPDPAKAKPTTAQLLADALARCHKLRNRHRRAACIDAARRHYGLKSTRSRRSGAPPRHRSGHRR